MDYTQLEIKIMTAFSAIGAAFSFFVGGVDNMVIALLVFIAIDYATGMAAAWQSKSLNSNRGFDGIKRKLIILLVVVVAHWLDAAMGLPDTFKSMTVFAYVGNEGISIFENIDRIGYGKYIPNFLRVRLAQLRDERKNIEKEKI
jgi:toxin secretion/phage lysis holin